MHLEDPLAPHLSDAARGGREAMEAILRGVCDDVYGLALRMLWHPEDAADATQEILLKVSTHLGEFRGESAVRTWVYRIASNHLLRARERRSRGRTSPIEMIEAAGDAAALADESADDRVLALEVKLGCSHAMLHALDEEHRLAYILGELLELPGAEAAAILEIQAPAFRQRLTRARARIRGVMAARCGLVDPSRPCRCERRVEPARRQGLVDPSALRFAAHPIRGAEVRSLAAYVDALEGLEPTLRVLRSHPDYAAPGAVLAAIRGILEGTHEGTHEGIHDGARDGIHDAGASSDPGPS
ncbi:MAG: sigma-70 family RNA polymerase sigma factor [Nannocystaceae bacterium]